MLPYIFRMYVVLHFTSNFLPLGELFGSPILIMCCHCWHITGENCIFPSFFSAPAFAEYVASHPLRMILEAAKVLCGCVEIKASGTGMLCFIFDLNVPFV